MDLLKEEMEFFEENRQSLVERYKGQFVLVKGQRLIGAFTTAAEAYDRGVSEFGRDPFLIKRVLTEDPQETQPALFHSLIRADI